MAPDIDETLPDEVAIETEVEEVAATRPPPPPEEPAEEPESGD